jgi:hypothetical protein
MATQEPRSVNPDDPSDDYLPPPDDEPVVDASGLTVGPLPEDF